MEPKSKDNFYSIGLSLSYSALSPLHYLQITKTNTGSPLGTHRYVKSRHRKESDFGTDAVPS